MLALLPFVVSDCKISCRRLNFQYFFSFRFVIVLLLWQLHGKMLKKITYDISDCLLALNMFI